MKDCPTEEVLSAYVDDELDATTAADIAAHLRQCPRCAACAREFSAVTQAFHKCGASPPDAADVEALWQRVRQEGIPHAKPIATVRRRFTRVLVAAAAAAIFAAIVLWPAPPGPGDGENHGSFSADAVLEVELYDDSAVIVLGPHDGENAVVWFMAPVDEVENGGAG